MEIRVHGRGGQGGVSCAKILAAAYARLGRSVQAFGDYAGERSGAPVRAYLRVSDEPIRNRNKVYRPDHLLVLDPTLLGEEVAEGLAEGGTALVNQPAPPEALSDRFPAFRLAVVDATAIARRHRIGSSSVVIVNTTIAGAFAKAFDLPVSVLEEVYRGMGLLSNLEAAREAYAAVRILAPRSPHAARRIPQSAPLREVPPLAAHREGPPTGLKTGNWRTQTPAYLRRQAPCVSACPAGNDVVGFVQELASGREEAAAEILARTTPLAGVCGRVCPAPCMGVCSRGGYDGAVNVRALERYVADRSGPARQAERPTPRGGVVAVVGGGPAGLSAARTLALAGRSAVLFEAEAKLGGVLVTGIPAYRLPREVLEREVAAISALGVDARCGVRVDRAGLAALSRDFEAVIVAAGLQRQTPLAVPGSSLAGISQGLRFLRQMNLSPISGPAALSGHVVVLGGGNTAMDCARSALRCGAGRVTVAYRRTRREMPAIAEEVDEAMEEGVAFLFQRVPVSFRGEDRVREVVLSEVEMGPPDETGRRRPVPSSRTHALACDAVLLALGQSPDLSLLPEGWEPRAGRVWMGARPLNVFAAGDFSTGDGTVAHAIGSGRRAAHQVLALASEAPPPDADGASPVPPERIHGDRFERRSSVRQRQLSPDRRRGGFAEVNAGLDGPAEALRCFSCGTCTGCDTCLAYCPEGIIRRQGAGYEVDLEYCKGCGVCVDVCPRGAMEMVLPT